MISFFNLFELYPAFICTNSIGSLVNSLFRVKIFNPFPYVSSSSSYSTKIGGMVLFLFQGINFTLSVIVSSYCDLLFFSQLVVA